MGWIGQYLGLRFYVRVVTKPEELGPRNHGKVESGSTLYTLGTTHAYMDERLPFPMRKTEESSGNYTEWVSVEATNTPCDNDLGS